MVSGSRRSAAFLALLVTVMAGCGGDGSSPIAPSSPMPSEFPPGDPNGTEPYLVRDINPGGSSIGLASARFFAFRGRVFFNADDGIHGLELWETDGTAPGTRLVADICPGPCGSDAAWFTPHGDQVLFQARDAAHGQELWSTDGTAAGTRMILDLLPGPDSGAPFMFAPLGDRLLLQVFGPRSSLQLWSTDGTPGGTTLVREISPLWVTPPSPLFASANGLVFFGTNDWVSGHELWVTDGTADGTRLVRDICPGHCEGAARSAGRIFEGRLFFAARTAQDAPTELWVSDGTSSGTRSMGIPFAALPRPAVFAGALVFNAGLTSGPREVWRTDGTPRGTHPLAPCQATSFYQWRGLLFIGAGHDVWVTDGTAGGTGQIPAFAATGFAGVGGHVYFDAWSEAEGGELWRSDGTVEGTHLVEDIGPGPSGSTRATFQIFSSGDRIFFPADDGRAGHELWAYRPPD